MYSPRRSFIPLVPIAALIVALGWGCGRDSGSDGPSPESSPDVVATFDGGVVLRAEFDRFEEHKPVSQDIQISPVEERDWRVVRVKEIVLRKVLGSEVLEDDAAVQAALHQATTSIVIAAMKRDLGWDRITATPQELREYYEDHRDRYADPRMARAEHVFLRAEDAVLSAAERSAVRAKLEGIRQEVLSGADFTELARRHSESDDADRGGVMTLKADANVFPAFADAVWALEVGEVSEVIEIPTGFQLVKMREIIPAVQRPFDSVVDFVKQAVVEEKAKAVREEFVREIGPKHGLETHYDRLSNPHISPDESLVVMDGAGYRFRDLDAELSPTLRAHLYGAYFPKIYEFLDEVVVNILLLKEAERLELAAREDVAAQIEAAVAEVRYRRGLDQRLAAKGLEVAEEDLVDFFVQNEPRFATVARQDLDVILIRQEEGEPFWSTLRRAEELVERLRNGGDFAELARTHSAHYSASNGGRIERLADADIGEIVHGRPAFRAVLKKLGDGEISDPMIAECYDTDRMAYTRTGVIIARIAHVYPAEQKRYEEVRELVRENYVRRNHRGFTAEIRNEVLAGANLEILFDHLPPI